jgi:hypothetical protein
VYEDDEHSVRIVDLGGRQADRKRWIHCFENLDLVVEFFNIYGMHLPLYEDENVLEANESALLASEIFGSKWMINTKRVVVITGFELFERNFSSNQKLIEEKLGKIEDDSPWTRLDAWVQNWMTILPMAEFYMAPRFLFSEEAYARYPEAMVSLFLGKEKDYWYQRGNLHVLKLSPDRWTSQKHLDFQKEFRERIFTVLLVLNRFQLRLGKDLLSMLFTMVWEAEDSVV